MDAAFNDALAEALRFLARRDRFEAQIRAHLASKEMSAHLDEVIVYLRQRKILDETKLTQTLVARYAGKRAVGKEKLRAELLRQGAPEEEIDQAMAELPSEEESTLNQLLGQKIKAGDSRAKAGRFLSSRGFGESEIESALDRFFGTD